MSTFEILTSHLGEISIDKQETPIKKSKEVKFTSAETMTQTPERSVPEDIDPQYLFEHFDELIKVELTGNDIPE
jgi:hypothetical protein